MVKDNAGNGLEMMNQEVLSTGLCCFCGTCVAACPVDKLALDYDKEEAYCRSEKACPPHCQLCYQVCPGKDMDYPSLESSLFGRPRKAEEWELGIYRRLAGGYATNSSIRRAGSSGGAATALLQFSLSAGQVAAALVASTDRDRPWRGIPLLAQSQREVEAAARSKYTVIPINALIKKAARQFGKMAVTALPCQVAGIRKAQRKGLKDFLKVELLIGISCAYCASNALYPHLICEVLNIPLEEVAKVEFRGGPYPGEFRVYCRDGTLVSCPSSLRLLLALGFIRDRCSMCLDWGAELADLALADLPKAEKNDAGERVGNTAIIVRTPQGEAWLRAAEDAGWLRCFQITEEQITGNIGLEWKKHGFWRHLQNRKSKGWPVPSFGLQGDGRPRPRPMHIAATYLRPGEKF